MLSFVTLVAAASSKLDELALRLGRELRCAHIAPGQSCVGDLVIDLREWRRCDPLRLDASFAAREGQPFGLSIVCEHQHPEMASLELLNRYQRLLPLPSRASRIPRLSQVLAAHRGLHPLEKPLARADYDHALDTWRWLLRLAPHADPALELAALFHDVERLETETERRVEQYAADHLEFKTRHAARGARMAERILLELGLGAALVRRVAELIEAHEQPGTDSELCLLNDADSISFFSLNSWGYLRYFGPSRTSFKVKYTLSRMSPAARALVGTTRQPAPISRMLADAELLTQGARVGHA